ncbi:MAG: hypothetical protein RIQ92_135 [Actinomycetota bacterium]|jgi:hypothetical protein
MKRVAILALLASLTISNAHAAPKAIPVQLGSIYSSPVGTELFLTTPKSSIFISNPSVKSSDIQVNSVDLTGTQLWQRIIDSGVDEVATAATIDPQGNIWLAGSAASITPSETLTPTAGIDNPDLVSVEAGLNLRSDMNNLALWKISATGDLIGSFTFSMKSVPLVTAISATNSGVSIIGSQDSKSFVISATASGNFGKMIAIGTSKTELNALSRNSDGTISLFGSSAETLAGKKVAGLRDGVLIKLSKSGAITSLVRSSALKASRSWVSGDAAHLLSGPVVTGKSVETAITKFTTTFAPSWTLRVPGTGASTTLTANGNSYLAFTSRSAITGVSGWRPSQPSLLVITFDGKGVMKAATALPGLVTPISLHYSAARGVVGLASSADGTVSIFTLASR